MFISQKMLACLATKLTVIKSGSQPDASILGLACYCVRLSSQIFPNFFFAFLDFFSLIKFFFSYSEEEINWRTFFFILYKSLVIIIFFSFEVSLNFFFKTSLFLPFKIALKRIWNFFIFSLIQTNILFMFFKCWYKNQFEKIKKYYLNIFFF